ncbi:MAG: NAD(P)/FAD-dependent oxidoreductase [Halanaerobiales bacterium]
MEVDVIIVGAGPAGLFAAIQCSTGKNKVVVLEKNPSPGKKLLITGGGQCNLTQAGRVKDLLGHYGENDRFIRNSLYGFSNDDLLDFFRKRDIDFITTDQGKVFPSSSKAGDILKALLDECRHRKVIIKCSESVEKIKYTNPDFSGVEQDVKHIEVVPSKIDHNEKTLENYRFISRTEKREYVSRFLVLATGGQSYKTTGSSGDGYHFAKSLGHNINKPRPALTPLYIMNYQFADLSGISLQNTDISLWRNNKLVRRWSGDILLTHKGLSGPGILNYSRYIKARDVIKLNLTGIKDRAVLEKDLINRIEANGRLLFKNILRELQLPIRLADKLLDIAGISDKTKAAQITKDERKSIINLLYALPMTVERPGGFNEAMVTSGGISLKEISPRTMESRIIPNLFVVGEVLSIDGDTGGYNLQAAFSTGYMAGQTISGRIVKSDR